CQRLKFGNHDQELAGGVLVECRPHQLVLTRDSQPKRESIMKRIIVHSIVVLSVVMIFASAALAKGVHALFDLSTPSAGPFPSDVFTVPDPTQNSGLRVNLPYPNCAVRSSDCQDLDVINTLDRFNVQPRLSIPFDGPIDAITATSQTVLII